MVPMVKNKYASVQGRYIVHEGVVRRKSDPTAGALQIYMWDETEKIFPTIPFWLHTTYLERLTTHTLEDSSLTID